MTRAKLIGRSVGVMLTAVFTSVVDAPATAFVVKASIEAAIQMILGFLVDACTAVSRTLSFWR